MSISVRKAGRWVRDAVGVKLAALALWALVHGLVSLEISGLVPGTDQERADRYARTLGRLGGALLG